MTNWIQGICLPLSAFFLLQANTNIEWTAIIAAVGALVTAIVTPIIQNKRLIASREQDRLDRMADAEALSRKQAQMASDLREAQKLEIQVIDAKARAAEFEIRKQMIQAEMEANKHRKMVLEELKTNTKLTEEGVKQAGAAMSAANNVNKKILDLGLDKRLQTTVDSIQADVTEIKDVVVEA